MTWLYLLALYPVLGLLTTRKVRHVLENRLDAHNARIEPIRDHEDHCYELKYNTNQKVCACGTPVRTSTMRQKYGGSAWGMPVWFGVLWIVAIPLYGVNRAAKVAVHSIEPGWAWFFENPKHRKTRKAKA